jgi:hypothetical protein
VIELAGQAERRDHAGGELLDVADIGHAPVAERLVGVDARLIHVVVAPRPAELDAVVVTEFPRAVETDLVGGLLLARSRAARDLRAEVGQVQHAVGVAVAPGSPGCR